VQVAGIAMSFATEQIPTRQLVCGQHRLSRVSEREIKLRTEGTNLRPRFVCSRRLSGMIKGGNHQVLVRLRHHSKKGIRIRRRTGCRRKSRDVGRKMNRTQRSLTPVLFKK